MPHRLKQLRDLAGALRLHHKFKSFEEGSVEALKAYQEERMREVVRHAATHSPHYGKLCAGVDLSGDFALSDLPITDKRQMMENFDDWVTDPRLKLDALEHQIATDPGEEYFLGEYRIASTSGSSGLRGIYVYNRAEWQVVIAAALRWAEMFGVSPLELSRKRLASIKADKPNHPTSRLGQSMQLGLRNLMLLDATAPLDEIVRGLNDYQPELLMGYASIISLLAIEQIEGRLKIQPEMVATFSEMLGQERVDRAKRAWGITPFNHYGAAEQITIAADCDQHNGLHHFADMSIIEIVDENNDPVPPGVQGHKVLLTNLHKFVQPIIRYELTDLITESPRSCPCGRPFPVLAQIGGRTEDVIAFRAADGELVRVSPLVIHIAIAQISDVTEYQYSPAPDHLLVRVVPRGSANRARLAETVRSSVASALGRLGVAGVRVDVEFVEQIVRSGDTMGKVKVRV